MCIIKGALASVPGNTPRGQPGHAGARALGPVASSPPSPSRPCSAVCDRRGPEGAPRRCGSVPCSTTHAHTHTHTHRTRTLTHEHTHLLGPSCAHSLWPDPSPAHGTEMTHAVGGGRAQCPLLAWSACPRRVSALQDALPSPQVSECGPLAPRGLLTTARPPPSRPQRRPASPARGSAEKSWPGEPRRGSRYRRAWVLAEVPPEELGFHWVPVAPTSSRGLCIRAFGTALQGGAPRA